MSIINAYYGREKSSRGENPQYAFAKDYFDHYLAHRPSRAATKAIEQVFTMWGMVEKSSKFVDAAIDKIRHDEDIFDVLVDGMVNSYSRDHRFSRKFTVLDFYRKLLSKDTGPKGRLLVEFRLAEAEMDMGYADKADQQTMGIYDLLSYITLCTLPCAFSYDNRLTYELIDRHQGDARISNTTYANTTTVVTAYWI